jgi:tetratricopeptide (TPR) repeat protein
MIRTIAAACLCAVASAPAAADPARTISFTTKSAEAQAHARETIRRIESLQFGPAIQDEARKAVAADPEFAFGHYLVGVTGPGDAARPELDKATELARAASDGERRFLEAALLNRAGKRDEAAAAVEKLRADYPDERMVIMLLGQVRSAQGKLDDAQAAFEKAIALDPATPRAYALLGNVLLLQGDYAAARARFETAGAKKVPGTAPGNISYGIAFSHLYEGHADAALATLEGFLGEYRKNAPSTGLPEVFIWNSIARINLENGRLEEAMKAYAEGFKSVPGSSLSEQDKQIWRGRLHHGTGRTLARMGKHEAAWREAETIKKMIDEGGDPGKQFVPSYHYLAGYLKLEVGDYPAAIEHLKQTTLDDPFHKLLLARAYERAGDKENARKAYAEVVASTQSNLERALAYPEAKRKLAAL